MRRKVDPGWQFPWSHLAQEGFGLWCKQPLAGLAPVSDVALALQAIGYDVADPIAAIAAFRRHFLGITTEGDASDEERRLMHCLVLEKRMKQSENGAQ